MALFKQWFIVLCLLSTTQIFSIKIVIDPGHGGRFEGCKSFSGNILEKDIALQIAQEIKKILYKKNITVVLTRTDDRDFVPENTSQEEELAKDLEQRVKLIKKEKPDALISIHLNSTTNKDIRGYELFVPFSVKYPEESYKLAAHIHHSLSQKTEKQWAGTIGNLNIRDRGIRAANFTLLRNHQFPAVLVELDYITNQHVEQNFKSAEYRQNIARIIADGIVAYFN